MSVRVQVPPGAQIINQIERFTQVSLFYFLDFTSYKREFSRRNVCKNVPYPCIIDACREHTFLVSAAALKKIKILCNIFFKYLVIPSINTKNINAMIFKMNSFIMVVILFSLLACKKETSSSDLTFSQTCNFSGFNVESVDMLHGSLRYTDNISNFSLSGHKFVIESSHRLPMVICNMPSSFEMAEDQSINVRFSGRVNIIPNEADATNTDIELSYLKFEIK